VCPVTLPYGQGSWTRWGAGEVCGSVVDKGASIGRFFLDLQGCVALMHKEPPDPDYRQMLY
jgi:hypothetical protein